MAAHLQASRDALPQPAGNPLLSATFGAGRHVTVDDAWSAQEQNTWGDPLGALPRHASIVRHSSARGYASAVDAPPYYPAAPAVDDAFNSERRLPRRAARAPPL